MEELTLSYRQQLISKSTNFFDFFPSREVFEIDIQSHINSCFNNAYYTDFNLCLADYLKFSEQDNYCIVCDSSDLIKLGIKDGHKIDWYPEKYNSDVWFLALDDEEGLVAINYDNAFYSDYFNYSRSSLNRRKRLKKDEIIYFPFIINQEFLKKASKQCIRWVIVKDPGCVVKKTKPNIPKCENDVSFSDALLRIFVRAQKDKPIDIDIPEKEDRCRLLRNAEQYILVAEDISPKCNDEKLKSLVESIFIYPNFCLCFNSKGRLTSYRMSFDTNKNFIVISSSYLNSKPDVNILYDYITWNVYKLKDVKKYWQEMAPKEIKPENP